MIVNLQRKIKLDSKPLRNYVDGLSTAIIEASDSTFSVAFVSDRRMIELNKFFRGKDATTDVLHGVGRTALARIDRRRLVGHRVCDIGVGDDEGPGGTSRVAERNIGPVRHADRRTLVEGTIDCAPLGRRRRGCNRRCGVEGGLMPPVQGFVAAVLEIVSLCVRRQGNRAGSLDRYLD